MTGLAWLILILAICLAALLCLSITVMLGVDFVCWLSNMRRAALAYLKGKGK